MQIKLKPLTFQVREACETTIEGSADREKIAQEGKATISETISKVNLDHKPHR